MRLNRMTGATPAKAAAPVASAAATQSTSGLDIQESFVQSDQVEEREASPNSAEEAELLAMFPGIAEGLTSEYLELGWELTEPLEAPEVQDPETIDQEQVLNCSETVHLKSKILDQLSQHPPGVRSLIRSVLDDEDLLASFVAKEDLGDLDEFVQELNEATENESPVLASELFHNGLYESVELYSRGHFSHRYALQLALQTKQVMSGTFPELFLELPVIVKVVEANQNNASHEWVSAKHRLTLTVKEPFGNHRENLDELVSTGSFDQAYHFRRGVTDLVSFIHEYAHAIYDKILGVPASIKMTRVNRSISEGFAILLELLAIDSLQSECSDMDHRDFQERRDQRVTWLQSALQPGADDSTMAYAEGVELMVNVFREGGLSGVAEFLRTVSPAKADGLSRANAKYREAIADPEMVLDLVS